MTWWLYLAGGVVALLAARYAAHRAAKAFQWRIGAFGLLLPGRRAQACQRCRTSYEYTRPHGTPCVIQGQAGLVLALCQTCWAELGTPGGRIGFYEQVFREWDADPAVRRSLEDLYAVRAAVAAGL